jgi:micrococcal nuclease
MRSIGEVWPIGDRAAGLNGPILRQVSWLGLRAGLVAVALLLCAGCAPALTTAPAATPSATSSPLLTPAPTPTVDPEASPTPLVPAGQLQDAVVMRIVDGDTIWVRFSGRDWRVRYIGIDAPEMGEAVPEPWATEATEANRQLVEGQTFYLERDVSETDRFGRLLRYVWLPPPGEASPIGWRMVNLELVRAGLAHARSFPPDVAHQEWLRAAEEEARNEGAGLWGDQSP